MRYSLVALIGALAMASASCGDWLSPSPKDPPLSGKWGMLCGIDVSCELELSQGGSTVSGRYGERVSGRESFSGNIITGTYSAPTFHLEWRDNGISSSIDGVVQGDTEIVGTWHDGRTHVIQADFFKAH